MQLSVGHNLCMNILLSHTDTGDLYYNLIYMFVVNLYSLLNKTTAYLSRLGDIFDDINLYEKETQAEDGKNRDDPDLFHCTTIGIGLNIETDLQYRGTTLTVKPHWEGPTRYSHGSCSNSHMVSERGIQLIFVWSTRKEPRIGLGSSTGTGRSHVKLPVTNRAKPRPQRVTSHWLSHWLQSTCLQRDNAKHCRINAIVYMPLKCHKRPLCAKSSHKRYCLICPVRKSMEHQSEWT